MKRNLFLSLLLVLSVVPLSSCKKYHTVYFHPHRGCTEYFIEVLHNSTIPLFEEIDFYDDDTFLGWYYGDTYWVFDEYKVTEDMDLSARWTTDNTINTDDATIIKFWMYGNDIELAFYKNIVEEFNTLYKGKINVKLQPKSPDGYHDALNLVLGGSIAPDIFSINENGFKGMAEQDMLMDISEVIASNEDYDLSSMWECVGNRFQYDVETKTNDGPNKKFYAAANHLETTALYYNESIFNDVGVKVISVNSKDLKEFNEGASDDRGQTKASLGIFDEVKEKGYFIDSNGQKWFNNQIPMSWEETADLAQTLQKLYGSDTKHSYYTQWWYNYGWSVGGDAVQFIPTDDEKYLGGVWDFTILDSTKNYIVDDNALPFEINGNTYQPGEILSYQDKLIDEELMLQRLGMTDDRPRTVDPIVLAAVETGQLEELPSQKEAYIEYLKMTTPGQKVIDTIDNQNICSYGVAPNYDLTERFSNKASDFGNGNLAMMVDTSSSKIYFEEKMSDDIKWDIAPLPIYKKYDENGDVIVHGVNAGHTQVNGISIWSKTKHFEETKTFLNYLISKDITDSLITNKISLPLEKNATSYNDIPNVLLTDLKTQRAADLSYFKNDDWIESWNKGINENIKTGKYTLSNYFSIIAFSTQNKLLEYSQK